MVLSLCVCVCVCVCGMFLTSSAVFDEQLAIAVYFACVQIAIDLQHLKLEGIDKDDPMFGDWARVCEDEWTDFRRK